ncbi:MAG: hypothetical protein HUN04_22875 [Desulfobacter sp.]|nr:MAG: hypothetical protein HUN04_22875 [Desulfobacter sp.]
MNIVILSHQLEPLFELIVDGIKTLVYGMDRSFSVILFACGILISLSSISPRTDSNSRGQPMGRIKNWLMDMEDDAHQMGLEKFIRKHGREHAHVWRQVNTPSEKHSSFVFYNTANDLSTADSSNEDSKSMDENTSTDDIPF